MSFKTKSLGSSNWCATCVVRYVGDGHMLWCPRQFPRDGKNSTPSSGYLCCFRTALERGTQMLHILSIQPSVIRFKLFFPMD